MISQNKAMVIILIICLNLLTINFVSAGEYYISKFDTQRCLVDLKNADVFALAVCVGSQNEERSGYFSILLADGLPESGSLGFTFWDNKVRLIEAEPPEEFFILTTEQSNNSDPILVCSRFFKINFPEEKQWRCLEESTEVDEKGNTFINYSFQSVQYQFIFQLKIWTKINRIVYIKNLPFQAE